MWAYPQKSKSFRDALVCCVKHNPDPVVLLITCTGVEPEIRIDKKQLDFKKVLLHRFVNTCLQCGNADDLHVHVQCTCMYTYVLYIHVHVVPLYMR